jgi:aspartate racemase
MKLFEAGSRRLMPGSTSMHIGLIGGIGPAATEHYYRGLIERHGRSGVPLELTIVHADVRELSRNAAARARQKQAEIFAGLVRRLAGAGAELAAVTSMGGHFCFAELEPLSPLPLVNAIPEVAAAIRERGLRTIGILGNKLVMETGLYGGISSARIVTPEGDALERVHRSYIAMAQAGRVTEEQRRTFFAAGEWMHRELAAEAVLLGGTDLFLAFAGQECGFPVIDCATIHIDAIYHRALD